MRWKLDTIKGRWAVPGEAGGGGAWYPPSVDGGNGVLGHRESVPVRRHAAAIRTAARTRARRCTRTRCSRSTARSGTLAWYDQVTPHDVRDHDFQLSPVLGSSGGRPAVFGAGKGGVVDRVGPATHKRLWQTEVGVHRNDSGPLPPHRVAGVPRPVRRRRDADGVRLRAALSPGREPLRSPAAPTATRTSPTVDPSRGTGELVALDARTGKQVVEPEAAAAGLRLRDRRQRRRLHLDLRRRGLRARRRLGRRALEDDASAAGVNACPALDVERGSSFPRASRTRRGGVTELVASS